MTDSRLFDASDMYNIEESCDVILNLLNEDADVFKDMFNYMNDNGYSFFHMLCVKEYPSSLIIAVDKVCQSVGLNPWEVPFFTEEDFVTPLHYYALCGSDVDVLRSGIVRYPTNLTAKNINGYTPLHEASNNKHNKAAFVATLKEVRTYRCC